MAIRYSEMVNFHYQTISPQTIPFGVNNYLFIRLFTIDNIKHYKLITNSNIFSSEKIA